MKKFHFILLLMVMMGLTAAAQYSDPKENTPGYIFQTKLKFPVEPMELKGVTQLAANPSDSGSDNSNRVPFTIEKSYRSTTFDPTWADRFQEVLDSGVAATGVKGASAAILVPGQGLWTGVSGMSSMWTPINANMRFGFASNTKLFIAVTLEKLQEDGVLSLDDHLYQWIPSYPYVDSNTTIRQLLSHQSGIYDFWNDHITFFWNTILGDTARFWTPEEVLATIGPPHFAPGHGYSYSNTNYLLAGMVIDAATGSSWVQKLHDVILDPMSMDSTFIGAFEPPNGPVAHEWVASYGEVVNSPMTSAYSFTDASASLLSTPQEMVEWYRALFNGEIISESSLQELLNFDPSSFYGLGITEWMMNDNHYGYVHTGAMIGCLSEIFIDVKTNSVMCLVTNQRINNFGDLFIPLVHVLMDEYPRQPNDAGIVKIITPRENSCSATLIPAVMLTNFGSSPLNVVDINYQVDQDSTSVFTWTGTLNPDDTVMVTLPEITPANGLHTLSCYTSLPNGEPEGYTSNDISSSNFIEISTTSTIYELSESFDDNVFPPEGWILNNSSIYQWGKTSLAAFNGSGSAVRSNYNDGTIGACYDLDLPMIYIGAGTSPNLEFEYAYARYPNADGDSLQVFISTDCGLSWSILFNQGGSSLATAPTTNKPFYPNSGSQWKQESISLGGYSGDVLIRFRDICGFGNNLFLDDITLGFPAGLAEDKPSTDFTVYPNPALNAIYISGLPVNSEIQVTDLTGKLWIKSILAEFPAAVNIEDLPQGMYILKTVYGVKKIVKL